MNFGFWDLLKNIFIRLVEENYEYGKLLRRCNPSFITFIPKVGNSTQLREFIPISLEGCSW